MTRVILFLLPCAIIFAMATFIAGIFSQPLALLLGVGFLAICLLTVVLAVVELALHLIRLVVRG